MITTLQPINVEQLVNEYTKLESSIVWTEYNKGKQTSLQYREGEDPWTSAVGRSKGDELNFSQLNPYFAGTAFETIIKQFNLKRTRFMWIYPGCCYTMHNDSTMRVHVPLYTSTQSFMVFKEGLVQHLPAGYVYLADTRKLHTAMNGSLNEPRLHLVGAVENQ